MTSKKNMLTLLVIACLMLSVPYALAKNQASEQGKGKPAVPAVEDAEEDQETNPIELKAADNGFNGRGKTKHLNLVEKDADWATVSDGAGGKMTFKENWFVFNAHGLTSGLEYYYPDPWPGTGLIVLGKATADVDGNVHIKESFDFNGIPVTGDTNAGAKIWLVLTSDLSISSDLTVSNIMVGWNPFEYLFESSLINPDTLFN
jgi:hypothetical protein